MLIGASAASENIKTYKRQGMSEAAATAKAFKDESLSQRESRIRDAVRDHVSPPKQGKGKAEPCCGPSDAYCYVKDIFDTQGFAIVEKGSTLLRVPFTETKGVVTCGTPTAVREVKTYEPV